MKHHTGKRGCDEPLESCTSFGIGADFVIRHGFGREIDKSEMRDRLQHAWDAGLVLNADNVQRRVSFICHCCACCCDMLRGISRFGYPGAVVTSSYIVRTDLKACTGCGNCARDCPIDAIGMTPSREKRFQKHGMPVVDEKLCLGCGVCTRRCKSKSLALTRRAQRVIHPETTFERVILQSLDRGNLQNLIFDNPLGSSGKFLRGLVGGFLRLPPVKWAMMSDALRSRFLAKVKDGVSAQGLGWLLDI